jgi:hypothetical protein
LIGFYGVFEDLQDLIDFRGLWRLQISRKFYRKKCGFNVVSHTQISWMMISAIETVIGWLNMAGKSISDQQNMEDHVYACGWGYQLHLTRQNGRWPYFFFESARVYRLPRMNWIMSWEIEVS